MNHEQKVKKKSYINKRTRKQHKKTYKRVYNVDYIMKTYIIHITLPS